MSDGVSDAAKGYDYYMWGKPSRRNKMKSATETVFTLVGGPTGVELVYRRATNDQETWTIRDTRDGGEDVEPETELAVTPALLRRAADAIEANTPTKATPAHA